MKFPVHASTRTSFRCENECFQKPVITGHVATEDLTCVVSNFEPLRALHVFTKPCARYEEQQMLQAVTKNDFCEQNKI